MFFFRHAKYSILELQHSAIGTTVSFGEHADGVALGKSVTDQLAHAGIFLGILVVYWDTTYVVEDPSENGDVPKFALGDKGANDDARPDNVDVQETLVVGHDNEIGTFGDIFFADHVQLDSKNLEQYIKIGDTDTGTFLPLTQKSTTEKHVGDADDDKGNGDGQVIKYCSNKRYKSHNWNLNVVMRWVLVLL